MGQLSADRLSEYEVSACKIRPEVIETDMTPASMNKHDRLVEQETYVKL